MAIRQQRIAQIILKEVSEMLQCEIKDAEIGFVTVADVEMSNDYSFAKIFVTFLDKEKGEELQLKALNRYAKSIRGALGKKLMIRKIPEISFHIDASFEQGRRIDEIIDILNKKKSNYKPSKIGFLFIKSYSITTFLTEIFYTFSLPKPIYNIYKSWFL